MTKFPDKHVFPEPTFSGKPAFTRSQSKTGFMLELLNSGSLSETQKLRFLQLSIQELKEMESGGELAKKAMEMVEQLREEVGGKSNDSEIIVEETRVATDERPKEKPEISKRQDKSVLPHRPQNTIDFLNKFQKDGYGLKELTHTPADLENIDFEELKKRVQETINQLYSKDEHVHKWVYIAAKKLKKAFFKIVNSYNQSEERYPYGGLGGDESYTKTANKFKSNYRYSVEGEGYSVLRQNLQSAFKSRVQKFKRNCQLMIDPAATDFDDTCNLLTWIPAFVSGINLIFEQIEERLTNEGYKTVIKIYASIKKKENINYVQLDIVHKDSSANKPPDKIFQKYAQSVIHSLYFRSLCDWSIEFHKDNTNINYRLNLLNYFKIHGEEDIQKIDYRPEGFTHRIIFYDV